jgi:hypothetical protein
MLKEEHKKSFPSFFVVRKTQDNVTVLPLAEWSSIENKVHRKVFIMRTCVQTQQKISP